MSQPYTIKWGILATGRIAQAFTKDLLVNPATRDVSDVHHEVVAAASSSSSERAQKFLEDCKAPSSAKAYGSYKELAEDPNVDIIYVATPHSHHFQNTMLCLEAKKNVLCEKAFTVNAKQARKLVETAKKNGVFLMEAVWIRFFPLCKELRSMVQNGDIGEVHRVFADFSMQRDVDKVFGATHRMTNMDLAGGCMLDLGIYSITWIFQFLYHILPQDKRTTPQVVSSMTKYHLTGADESTSIIMTFPGTQTHGIATTNLRVSHDPDNHSSAGPAIRIQGLKGEIQVFGPAARPETYRVVPVAAPGEPKAEIKNVTREIPGHGMFWEADECARCIRDGKKESEGMSWEESCVIMDAMDAVRQQNDLVYPAKIESDEYPLEGF